MLRLYDGRSGWGLGAGINVSQICVGDISFRYDLRPLCCSLVCWASKADWLIGSFVRTPNHRLYMPNNRHTLLILPIYTLNPNPIASDNLNVFLGLALR